MFCREIQDDEVMPDAIDAAAIFYSLLPYDASFELPAFSPVAERAENDDVDYVTAVI